MMTIVAWRMTLGSALLPSLASAADLDPAKGSWRPSVIGGDGSRATGGAKRPGFMLLSVIDAEIVT
jgi:hypothetical protein